MIAAVGSVLLTPWNLYNNPDVIHYTLEPLGAFIGPLFGVLIADFYLVRKQKIVVDDLFTLSETANYWYRKGYNPAAMVATVVGAVLAVAPVLVGGSCSAWPAPRSTAGSSAAGSHWACTSCWPPAARGGRRRCASPRARRWSMRSTKPPEAPPAP